MLASCTESEARTRLVGAEGMKMKMPSSSTDRRGINETQTCLRTVIPLRFSNFLAEVALRVARESSFLRFRTEQQTAGPQERFIRNALENRHGPRVEFGPMSCVTQILALTPHSLYGKRLAKCQRFFVSAVFLTGDSNGSSWAAAPRPAPGVRRAGRTREESVRK